MAESLVDSEAAWRNVQDIKVTFDYFARDGYIRIDNEEIVRNIAETLHFPVDVLTAQLQEMDLDANKLISFAELALWIDRHTVGFPLGIDVPDKREWQRGMPAYWTTVPPLEKQELPPIQSASSSASLTGRSRSRGRVASAPGRVPPDPDTSELSAFLRHAKFFEWDKVWEILGRHPGYVDMRIAACRFAAIHQAAYEGDVDVISKFLTEFRADPVLLTKDELTPEQVASAEGNTAAAELLATAAKDSAPARGLRLRGSAGVVSLPADEDDSTRHANQVIEFAKWEQWEQMFQAIERYPGCQNVRPDCRKYAAIHHVAYAGDVVQLRRLVESQADPSLLTRDGETALQVAEMHSNMEAMVYLASLDPARSGDPNKVADQLLGLAKNGRWDLVFQQLEPNKELVNWRTEDREFGLIHQAVFRLNLGALRKLIEHFKADVKMRTKSGKTVLEVLQESIQSNEVDHDLGDDCDPQSRAIHAEAVSSYLEACLPTINLSDDFVKYPAQGFVKIEDPQQLQRFEKLLADTHKPHNADPNKSNWTRDRWYASGKLDKATPVPTGYELVGVVRNENCALWRVYQISREVTKSNCAGLTEESPLVPRVPWTMDTSRDPALDWTEFGVYPEANEWLLFHASAPASLEAIARTGFTMKSLGSGGTTGHGPLYGPGTYFAESITKADEYARSRVETGEFAGCRTAALCRVLGGRFYYTDQQEPDWEGYKNHFQSTVGDRLKCRGTYVEYVAYDASATYLEYIIYYRRKGVPERHL